MSDGPDDPKGRRPIERRPFLPRWLSITLKAIGITLGLIILLPVVGLLVTEFKDHGPDVLAKVTVDIEVEGEPVLIERIVECRTFAVPAGELLGRAWKLSPTRYFPVVRGMGARLKSGGAIMMYTPYLCDHEVEGRWPFRTIKVTPNPPGALTMMAWTKNADDPEVLEIYASQAYFRHPEARVKINRIEVTDPPPDASVDPPGEFSWFAPKNVYYTRPEQLGVAENLSPRASRSPREQLSSARGYRSYSVARIPEDIWSQDETLKAMLREIEQPVVLSGALRKAVSENIRRHFFRPGSAFGVRGVVTWLREDQIRESASKKSGLPLRNLEVISYPLNVVGSRVELRANKGPPHLIARPHPFEESSGSVQIELLHDDQPMGGIQRNAMFPEFGFDAENLLAIWLHQFVFEGHR